MPLTTVIGTHVIVTCDACKLEREVCGKREPPSTAPLAAYPVLLADGWYRDIGTPHDKWYCPGCAGKVPGR